LNRLLNAEVQLRKHIQASKRKDQEHLCRPASDSLHAHECIDHFIVGKLVQALDRQLAGRNPRRQILEIRELLTRQPHAAKLLVGGRRELVG
jgi:hypothetical protein